MLSNGAARELAKEIDADPKKVVSCKQGQCLSRQSEYTVVDSVDVGATDLVVCRHKDGYDVQFQAGYVVTGHNPGVD